jgi:putative thioredoxin
MSQAPWLANVAEADFQREVLDRSNQTPVVVDFWAPWCGPCRALGPVLEKLVAERAGEVVLAKVNIDENQALAAQFGIMSIPAVIAFRDGQPILDFIGLLPEPQIREFLDRIAPSEGERRARKAEALEKTQPAEAEALYRQALESEPNQEEAVLGLVRLLIARGAGAEARALLDNASFSGARAEESDRLNAMLFVHDQAASLGTEAEARRRLEKSPADAQKLYELGCLEAAAGRYSEALPHLLQAAERNPGLATSKIRELMVKIFQIIGVRSPLANEYRDKLTTLLY